MVKIFFAALLMVCNAATNTARADKLSLATAVLLAEQQSPDLLAQTAEVDAARALIKSAGSLPNPKFAVGVDNVPVSGADQWSLNRDFMTMQKIGLIQELPNGKKRTAQVDAATATLARTEAERQVSVLQVRRDTALAWLNRYYLEQRLSLLTELDHENQLFADYVQAQFSGGKGMPADTIIPKQEAAELADRRDEWAGQVTKAKSALHRWVGVAGDDVLADTAPALLIDETQLRTHVHEHAELQVFAPMLAVAQAAVHEAEAMRRPDWEFELSYGHRAAMFGDLLSLQVTVGLPLFSGTRIEPQIAANHQAITRITAQRDAMLREHTEELEAELADYLNVTHQLTRMRETRLPLAQQKVELQLASYQANKVVLSVVLDARRELINTRLKLIELEANQAAVAARLYFTYGEGAR